MDDDGDYDMDNENSDCCSSTSKIPTPPSQHDKSYPLIFTPLCNLLSLKLG